MPVLPPSAKKSYVPVGWKPPATAATKRRQTEHLKKVAARAAEAAISAAAFGNTCLRVVTTPLYTAGQIVTVSPRTMPGQNFEGGCGRILHSYSITDAHARPKSRRPRTNPSTTRFVYDVALILRGATERSIDAKWIAPAAHTAQESVPTGHDPPAKGRRRSARGSRPPASV